MSAFAYGTIHVIIWNNMPKYTEKYKWVSRVTHVYVDLLVYMELHIVEHGTTHAFEATKIYLEPHFCTCGHTHSHITHSHICTQNHYICAYGITSICACHIHVYT